MAARLILDLPKGWGPLSIRFPRQEYWSGLSFPSQRDLPNPGMKPASPASTEKSGWLHSPWGSKD